jgi:phage-related baseplate assembly protein
VVLQRNISSTVIQVAPGGLVRTGDGSETFTITTDSGNTAWNSSLSAYQFQTGQSSISVPIAATTPGVAGNVQPGAITLLASSMPGVDTITNTLATTGGLDAESDAALRLRASTYFASLSRATTTAVQAAIASVQQGLTSLVLENTPAAGQFLVVVDDGSGSPPGNLLQAVYTAVDAVRPIGTSFTVQAPSVIDANIVMELTTAATADHPTIAAQVTSAVTAMVDTLPIGATLPITRISAVAYNTSSLVLNVSMTLNGGNADLVPLATQVVRASSITVS